MVDDDGLRGHQESMQALWDLRELHSLSLKDLQKETNTLNADGTLDSTDGGTIFKNSLSTFINAGLVQVSENV